MGIKIASYQVVFQEIPDEVTLSLNISNCPNRCKGCHSPQMMDDVGEALDEGLMDAILMAYAEQVSCICFMGGDSDPVAVEALAKYIRLKRPLLKIAWYSGRQEFASGIEAQVFDYIKLGPYIEKFGALRSSATNQRLYRILNGEFVDITSSFWKNISIFD